MTSLSEASELVELSVWLELLVVQEVQAVAQMEQGTHWWYNGGG